MGHRHGRHAGHHRRAIAVAFPNRVVRAGLPARHQLEFASCERGFVDVRRWLVSAIMSDEIRRTPREIAKAIRVEMSNVSLAQIWPQVSRLLEALSCSEVSRRRDA